MVSYHFKLYKKYRSKENLCICDLIIIHSFSVFHVGVNDLNLSPITFNIQQIGDLLL